MATATATNNILGQYEANLNAQAGTDRVNADKNTFLKLLVAQLTHQDPLNPAEDTEFVAQLAQFTSVEELQNLNKGMESLNSSYLRQQTTNAVNMIGMNVTAKGDMLYVQNVDGSSDAPTYMSSIIMNVPRDAAQVVANVYTTNADDTVGSLVYSANIGSRAEGSWTWQWPGTDSSGRPMADGNYIVSFDAVDADGKEVLVDTKSLGTVVLVETQADGNHKLMLDDNRIIYFNDIEYVSKPSTNTGSTTEEDKTEGSGDTDEGEDSESTEGSTDSSTTETGTGSETSGASSGSETPATTTGSEGSTSSAGTDGSTAETSGGQQVDVAKETQNASAE